MLCYNNEEWERKERKEHVEKWMRKKVLVWNKDIIAI
jgi:hypothetical protein